MDKERPAAQVSGHGNFGSLDADPPAAMRYTECRLQAFASAVLLADLEYDTVNMAPTFDGSQACPPWDTELRIAMLFQEVDLRPTFRKLTVHCWCFWTNFSS